MTAPLSLLTLLLLAVGVSADAFAVAVGKGLGMPRLRAGDALRLAVAFGLAQAVMPLIGYVLGAQLARYVMSVDHWVVFVLLGAIGLTMLHQAWRGNDDEKDQPGEISHRQLLVLSVATSIDALAVGIGFAFLDVNLLGAVSLIGVTTFGLTLLGVVVGHRAGARFRRPAEAAGGLVLIGIGTRILLSHLGVL